MGNEKSLDYHANPQPGKICVGLTKKLDTMEDLTLAYTPGVADVCRAISEDPSAAYRYTSKGRMVAVISNGTAVLGLGNIGPLASKPVMEGKVALLKKFANVDAIDVLVSEVDPHKLVDVIRAISVTYGGINLEDIKAPDCFIVEQSLRNSVDIPVFHDDQHGTAVCVVAALRRSAQLQGHTFTDMRFVFSGAGASAIATAGLLRTFGVQKENIILVDSVGVIYEGRSGNMNVYKEPYAAQTTARSLEDAMKGAHAFVGLSSAGLVTQDMVKSMHAKPIVFALANPDPEIRSEEVINAVPDAIAGTGRSDDANQVNNVLCFPFLFRGVLDVMAKDITPSMREAAAQAIASVSELEGRIIPSIMSKNLLPVVASAVAQEAMRSGVARKNLNIVEYKDFLTQEV